MQVCSANFGTTFYPIAVERFENDILNIKDGPAMKNKINDYKKNTLDPLILSERDEWIESHPQQAQNQSYLRDIELVLKQKKAKLLHNFILQLLEDNGFGMYKGTYEEEDEMI